MKIIRYPIRRTSANTLSCIYCGKEIVYLFDHIDCFLKENERGRKRKEVKNETNNIN